MANSSLKEPLLQDRVHRATVRKPPSPPANLAPEYDIVRFALRPNPRLLRRLALYPDDPTRAPYVRAAVVQGSLDDELFLVGKYIKPNLRFHLFTVESTELLADGTIDPAFSGFGLAWYQGQLDTNENGVLSAHLRAVLVDQFLGFDAAIHLAPTGTFHVGLWFSDSPDLAMISVPVAATGMGPLCTHPSLWVSLARRLL